MSHLFLNGTVYTLDNALQKTSKRYPGSGDSGCMNRRGHVRNMILLFTLPSGNKLNERRKNNPLY